MTATTDGGRGAGWAIQAAAQRGKGQWKPQQSIKWIAAGSGSGTIRLVRDATSCLLGSQHVKDGRDRAITRRLTPGCPAAVTSRILEATASIAAMAEISANHRATAQKGTP